MRVIHGTENVLQWTEHAVEWSERVLEGNERGVNCLEVRPEGGEWV